MDRKIEHQLDSYVHRTVGNRIPTIDDVKQAFVDGRAMAKKKAWNVKGTPDKNKPLVGFFKKGYEYYLKMIDKEDIGNLFAGDMVAWAYLSDLVPIHSVLSDRKKVELNRI